MVETLTEISSKRKFIVGDGWIDFIKSMSIECSYCKKEIDKKEGIVNFYTEKYDFICKACYDSHFK